MYMHNSFRLYVYFTMSVLRRPSAVSMLFATLIFDYVTCLELTQIQVPTHALMGARVVMLCRWALGPNDVLYSVKWYKDGKEFFRYVPRDLEPYRKFVLPGVHVEKSSPSGSNLTLAPTTLATSGRYRCEVSGERPRFQTVSKYANLLVVVLPSLAPHILGVKSHYRVGDHVNVSCTSGQAKPRVKLVWYINGEPVPAAKLTYIEEDETTSRSNVEFSVGKRLIGDVKLTCLARIASISWRSVEENATVLGQNTEDNKRLTEVSVAAPYPDSRSKASKGIPNINLLIIFFVYFIIFKC